MTPVPRGHGVNALVFTPAVFEGSLRAGLIASLTGLGGGVTVVHCRAKRRRASRDRSLTRLGHRDVLEATDNEAAEYEGVAPVVVALAGRKSSDKEQTPFVHHSDDNGSVRARPSCFHAALPGPSSRPRVPHFPVAREV